MQILKDTIFLLCAHTSSYYSTTNNPKVPPVFLSSHFSLLLYIHPHLIFPIRHFPALRAESGKSGRSKKNNKNIPMVRMYLYTNSPYKSGVRHWTINYVACFVKLNPLESLIVKSYNAIQLWVSTCEKHFYPIAINTNWITLICAMKVDFMTKLGRFLSMWCILQ